MKSIAFKQTHQKLLHNDLPLFQTLCFFFRNHKNEKIDKNFVECLKLLLFHAYNYGSVQLGNEVLNYMLYHINNPLLKEEFYHCMYNTSFYAYPLPKQLLFDLQQIHFYPYLDNLNPFMFYDATSKNYVFGLRVTKNNNNKGSDYEIFTYDMKGHLLRVFPLYYQFTHKTIKRLGPNHGVEDIRVIPKICEKTGQMFQNKYLGVGTTMNTHEEGVMRMSLFDVVIKRGRDGKQIIGVVCKNLKPLKGHDDHKKQKNWCPFYHEERLHFIYSVSPLVILRCLKEEEIKTENMDKRWLECVKHEENEKGGKLRGNTPPIVYTNERGENVYLFLAHYSAKKIRTYYHKFIEMTQNFQIARISNVFYFEQSDGLEFAINMIHHPKKVGHFFISYGVGDVEGRICMVKKENIEEMFT